MEIAELRKEYHRTICSRIIRITKNKGKSYPNMADAGSPSSIDISWALYRRLGCQETLDGVSGQSAGGRFETVTKDFVSKAFNLLQHLRPGTWHYSTTGTDISRFEQFEHLAILDALVAKDRELAAALGSDYIVRPDIVISRWPVSDEVINQEKQIVDSDPEIVRLTPFRETNRVSPRPILHASISCKWTIRSDRAQNTRTEALNLVRNRKGALPHIVAVTAEPLPHRIVALAMGTGDLDCVYHFALPELKLAIAEVKNDGQLELLEDMIQGRRLRDISDLPFDLAV